jgi:hypothetical protein
VGADRLDQVTGDSPSLRKRPQPIGIRLDRQRRMDLRDPLAAPGDHYRAARLLNAAQNSEAFGLELGNYDGLWPVFHRRSIASLTTMVNDYGQLVFLDARTDLSCSTTAMMVIRSFQISVVALALLLAAGCQNKGPTPKEGSASTGPARVGMTETGGAHPGGTQDPHAGMVPPQSPHGEDATAGKPDASGMIDVGAIAFKVPATWEAQQPKSSMRRAQVSAPGSAGAAELIVFYFGAQGAGTAKANIDRWVGQFSNPDGSPVSDAKPTASKVSGFDVTKVEVAGKFAGGMAATGQPQAAQAGQRLLAAIVDTNGGPYYFKFLGPDATVTEQSAAFDELLASVVPSP